MRASSLVREILKGCGVSINAARAMEDIAEQLLGNNDKEVFIEINGGVDKDFDKSRIDMNGSLVFEIEVDEEEIE